MQRRLATLIFCAIAAAQGADLWKVAPPAPASNLRDRTADLTARRKAVMEQIGSKDILVMYSAEPRNYAGDVDWPYRQENNFFYLTGIDQPGSTLILIPGATPREILFMPPSNPAQENWTGHILTPAEARNISGIAEIWDARHAMPFLAALLPQAKEVLTAAAAPGGRTGRGTPAQPKAMPMDVASVFRGTIEQTSKGDVELYLLRGRAAEFSREIELANKLAALSPPLTVKDPASIFSTLRRVKSPREIDILQHAAEITAEAFQRVYATAIPGSWEYEIQAQFEYTFRRRNAHWGYPCIVASGVNATTLHYETNQDQMKAGDLLLMDDAAEFAGYSVDVTRTIPVSGKFTKEQAEIYRLVWESAAGRHPQRAARPHHVGRSPTPSTGGAMEVFKQGLLKLGLITDTSTDAQVKIWFNHGIGHGIGLNVHDALGREFAPGMAITVEPGLYFRPTRSTICRRRRRTKSSSPPCGPRSRSIRASACASKTTS